MKISIPKIKTVRPKIFEHSEVRKALSHAIQVLDSTGKPIIGYAVVVFHPDGDYNSAWYGDRKLNLNVEDIPDLAKRRLQMMITRSP